MKVDEPWATGALKFAMMTGPFGEATTWADATALEPWKQLTASKKNIAQAKPKIETLRSLPRCFSKFLPFLAIGQAAYKLWHNLGR